LKNTKVDKEGEINVEVILYRIVDGELAYWGRYNLANDRELTTYTEAVWQFACNGYRVKAVRVEQ